jgi:hypothetical protein
MRFKCLGVPAELWILSSESYLSEPFSSGFLKLNKQASRLWRTLCDLRLSRPLRSPTFLGELSHTPAASLKHVPSSYASRTFAKQACGGEGVTIAMVGCSLSEPDAFTHSPNAFANGFERLVLVMCQLSFPGT